MTFRVVSCPICQGHVVVGEPNCRACGQLFNYGAAPPPAPSPNDIAAALAAFQTAQPAQPTLEPVVQDAAPSMQGNPPAQQPGFNAAAPPEPAEESFVDADRYDAPVNSVNEISIIDGLEPTHFAEVDVHVSAGEGVPGFISTDDELAEKDAQRVTSAPPQTADIWGGMLDQSLYGAYVPEHVDTPGLQDVERFDTAHRMRVSSKQDTKASDLVVCSDCGTETRSTLCPQCGAKTSTLL